MSKFHAGLFSSYFSSVYSTEQIELETSTLGKSIFNFSNNVIFSVRDVYRHSLALKDVWFIGSGDLLGYFLY